MAPSRRVLLAMECTIGGTRRHLAQLAHGLRKDRFEVTVVASAERDATFRDDLRAMAKAGCRVEEIPMVRSIDRRRDLEHLKALRKLIRELKPDIVHTHSSKAGALGRTASSMEGIGRRVHTPHTFAFAFAGGFSMGKRALFYGIERALGRMTDRLICVSASEAEQAQRLRIVSQSRIRVIPNGVDPEPFRKSPSRAEARRSLGWSGKRPIALLVALWNPAKGQLEACEAWARIPEERRPLLVLAGAVSDEAYGAEVRSAIDRLKLTDSILPLGHRSDIPLLLAAADFVIVPSRWEGMPYSVLEAMAAGRAVLATATNGSRDAVVDGSTGILVSVGDVDSLAAHAQRLAGDPAECKRLGDAGRARALSEFTIDTMLERTMALYDEVCA